MQILIRLYPFLIVYSVFGFHKGLLKFILGGFALMDCLTCLKHLTLDYEFGCGFLLFGSFKQVSEFLGMFLFLGFCLKFLYSDWLSRVFHRVVFDLRGKSVGLESGFCSVNGKCRQLKFLQEDDPKIPLIDKMQEMEEEKSNLCIDSDSDDEKNDEKESGEEDDEFDVEKLRKLLKIERQKAKAARLELEKERTASATAAEEAMAMILRLQNEKCLIEMESSQYRRLAEEKQIHDQEVIQSLQWLVWRHESERSLLEDQLKLSRRKLNRLLKSDYDDSEEAEEEAVSSFNGNICDALENVLYSSRE